MRAWDRKQYIADKKSLYAQLIEEVADEIESFSVHSDERISHASVFSTNEIQSGWGYAVKFWAISGHELKTTYLEF